MIATHFDYKKLAKRISKKYKNEGQILRLGSDVYLEFDGQKASSADIYFVTKDSKDGAFFDSDSIYLFEIVTQPTICISDCYPNYKAKKYTYTDYIDYSTIAYTPYYFDRIFFLRDKDFIEEQDIINCAKYFINNVLDEWCHIWNYKYIEYIDEEDKKFLDKEKEI